MRIRVQKGFFTSTIGLTILGTVFASFLAAGGVFIYYYVKYSRMIDARLSGNVLQNTTQIFSAPEHISAGQAWGPEDLTAYLTRVGYRPIQDANAIGQFTAQENTVDIRPSKLSYFAGNNALAVQFRGKSIRSIKPLAGGGELDTAEIEPELITNLFDSAREKRRPVRYEDLPVMLVDAILSAEDKRFFEHGGFDFIRIVGAAWADVRHSSQHYQGASTITMQVARTFFLSTDRNWRRKLSEAMISIELEQRFNKQQIFELYANEVYLGNRGSFGIRGFSEASVAYFGKDLRQLGLPECAYLAGIIRAPNYYSSADRHPERGVQARDRVLTQMLDNKYISAEDVQDAKRATLKIIRTSISGSEAPYFVDMVKDHLLDKYSENELLSENFRVYTTLDPVLQRAAAAAVDAGMKNVDLLLAKKYDKWRREQAKKGSTEPIPQAQAALVALDPRTGEIKAVIGGRDYGQSQLNHALAHRQPGSVFKPFVYAAAFDNAVDGVQPVITPATTIDDEPTTFEFDGKEYTPDNYHERFMGRVTVRDALTNSLNVATVKVAELIGYGRVVQVARKMGLGMNIQPTPSVALGAYEMTPIDVAAGYTTFATMGTRAEPQFLRIVVNADGTPLEKFTPQTHLALDPRVAFLVDSLLKDVLNRGTGASVRARGFTLPAAGKTGTSRDGWFAGFTSNLLCVIWIGFDDNRDIGLAGGVVAAPIWADFMTRATALAQYRDVKDFAMPDGVQSVLIDPDTLQLATANCPTTREEVYVVGSAPTVYCEVHGSHNLFTSAGSILSRVFGGEPKTPKTDANGQPVTPYDPNRPPQATGQAPVDTSAQSGEKKKNPLQKIFGIFGGKKKDPDKAKPKPEKGDSP
ncbi:MAG: penicillin-binding protein 1A [Acidobacteria bacterium]|nr:MAG: penicillin-binding protein 1A [Acidobacteriota bacterium]PYU73918.1 MAG: penicillin-binding protein 1A [Acidobacteriota bacterium]